MGKSPGKWIKTVLFGKKTSKSNFARGKEKPANEKEVHVRIVASETGRDFRPAEVPAGGLIAVHVDEQNLSSECRDATFDQQHKERSELDQNTELEQNMMVDTLTDAERIAQEEAAIKAQAAFRGYLARRAFKALKGIIRLQALIRGHLVRRQAVATLYCIIGVVKLQALVRGSKIRCSGPGIEVQRVCVLKPMDGKTNFHGDGFYGSTLSLSVNAFIRKLLAPSPGGMPLRVQYDAADPNSVQIWLERWSISCPWKPISPPKKVTNSRPQKKQGNSPAVEGETGRPKRSVRKVPSIFDNASPQSTSELEKPRRNSKKVPSHTDSVQENSQNELEKVTSELEKPRRNSKKVPSHTDSVQENPQNELEKVKRSLRKVHNPVTESSGQSEAAERPTESEATTTTPSVPEVCVPSEECPPENLKEEPAVFKEEVITITEANDQETTEEPVETEQSVDISNDEKAQVHSESFEDNEKDENTPVPNGDLNSSEESMCENQKSTRRASLPTKQENVEDGLQNTPKLPSYMQATQSAKAKLRGQGSPKVHDVADKNNLTRRHSLPSPANGKVSSVSPRTQKPLQGSGKGGNKSDKSLLSSRDGSGKGNQAQWRR